jgi:hypothetical protein
MIGELFMFKKLLPLLFLFTGFQANATLIDNGDYSTDTESGLDWLDWTLTTDKTQAEALTLYSGSGWRIASKSEALGLMDNFFGVDVGAEYSNWVGGSTVVDFASKAAVFGSRVGLTGFWPGYAYAFIEGVGLFGIDPGTIYGAANYWVVGTVGYSHWAHGVALVKVSAVSEPAIIALFSLGLVGIGFARRRQS